MSRYEDETGAALDVVARMDAGRSCPDCDGSGGWSDVGERGSCEWTCSTCGGSGHVCAWCAQTWSANPNHNRYCLMKRPCPDCAQAGRQ